MLGLEDVGDRVGSFVGGGVTGLIVGDSVGIFVVGSAVGFGVGCADGFVVGPPLDGDWVGNLLGFVVVCISLGASVGDVAIFKSAVGDGVGSEPVEDALKGESAVSEGEYVG